MKISFADLWRFNGTADRGEYALAGFVGFALLHNLDRLLATWVFHLRWDLFNYWVPLRDLAWFITMSPNDAFFLGTMVALALPFMWVGIAMTMKRLRSANLPLWLLILLFVPFLNLLFFLVLCLFPERSSLPGEFTEKPAGTRLARLLPESKWGNAAIAVLFTVPTGFGLAVLGVQWFSNYGWSLFVAQPFVMGFVAALIYGVRQARSLRGCVGVACLSVTLLGLAFLAFAFEGFICIIMATPIALPLAMLGGICGYLAQWWPRVRRRVPVVACVAFVFMPGIQWMEHAAAPAPQVFEVRSSIDIQASPEKVWQQVVAFTQIPPPTEWMFRAGVAYPIRAEMIGSGPGAERHCVFSTGAFVEPITVWDEPHLLRFSVASNPAPLEEWTPYHHIEPPHLHGFMASEQGQFLLTPLPNGGTRLEGTTWYHHGLWPESYWRLWSDPIIRQIHLRVLRHIRDQVERN